MGAWERSIRVAFGVFTVVGGLMGAALTPAVAGAAAAAPAAGCTAAPQLTNEWGGGPSGGEILQVTVTNTAAVTSTRWTVTWMLSSGQQVVSVWNAAYTPPVGGTGTATAANLAYNGTLAPGGSTTFGMQLAGTGSAPVMTCVSDATPAPTATVTPTATPTPTVTVTQTDAGTTVNLQVGQTLAVSLGPDWRPDYVSSPALALVSASGGYPTGQPLLAIYQAEMTGSAMVFVITDYACLHQPVNPCAVPQVLWDVNVNVTS